MCIYTELRKADAVAPSVAERLAAHFSIDGQAFDCRILLEQTGASLTPGQTAEVPIKFLWPNPIKTRLRIGSRFKLWEGKDFADGEVLEVLD